MTSTAQRAGKTSAARANGTAELQAQFRYVAVLLLTLTLAIFEVLAHDAAGARAIGVALAGAALTVAVATSRARAGVRRRRARATAIVALALVAAIALGVFPPALTWLVITVIIAAIPVAIGGGLLRLIREEGVTLQAVAGALAIYLVVGLLFASLIAFVRRVDPNNYFAQSGSVSNGDVVYYSFTVLTTTGFGDYTAATRIGHALAVLEMLAGQLYLVTVIGVLVGNFAGRRAGARTRN